MWAIMFPMSRWYTSIFDGLLSTARCSLVHPPCSNPFQITVECFCVYFHNPLCLCFSQTDSNTIHMQISLFMLWWNIRQFLKPPKFLSSLMVTTLVRICDTFSRMAEAFLPIVPSSITPPTWSWSWCFWWWFWLWWWCWWQWSWLMMRPHGRRRQRGRHREAARQHCTPEDCKYCKYCTDCTTNFISWFHHLYKFYRYLFAHLLEATENAVTCKWKL